MDDTISKNIRGAETERPDVRAGGVYNRNQRPAVAPESASNKRAMFTVDQEVVEQICATPNYAQVHSGHKEIMVESIPASAIGVYVRNLRDMLERDGRLYFNISLVPAVGDLPAVYGLKKINNDIGGYSCWMKPGY